jgi:type VI secretion system protein ImpL
MRFLKLLVLVFFSVFLLLLPPVVSFFASQGIVPGLLVSAGLLSLVLFIFFFRALWFRRKEKKFIDGISPREIQEETPEQRMSGELVKRWKEAVAQLRSSRLKLSGNPLYVLPWYMVMGESGSGKTTAIKNSRLSATFTSQTKAAGFSGTKNCDWWFFEQAIIIDTAGRYATQPGEDKDRDEWRIFLNQLARYRKKEPLNGLVVTVPADRVLSAGESDLREEGRKLRLRIEEIMQMLGAKFPVYVLVTKCDLIRGMKEFADSLPEAAHEQAMGCMNKDSVESAEDFLAHTFRTLSERLRLLRLHMAPKNGSDKMALSILLFPEEFMQLKKGLCHFAGGLFTRSVHRETPIFRGIYFTSARQSGDPLSHFVKKLGFKETRQTRTPSDQSYFLRELFDSILPGDRRLYVPTKQSLLFHLKTKAMGFSAWFLAFTVLCSLLSSSFGKTHVSLKTGGKSLEEAGDITDLSGDFSRDLHLLEQYRAAVAGIEERNRERWLPEFGLDQAVEMETKAKALFCRKFSKDFIGAYDRKMNDEAKRFTDATPSFLIGRTVAHYARRINLLEKELDGSGREELAKLPQPDFAFLVTKKDQGLGKKETATLENLYRHYLVWEKTDAVENEKKHIRDQLIGLAGKKDLSLRWMIDWCNENSGKQPITLSYFWGGSRHLQDEPVIRPSFTAAGSEMIMGILDELEESLADPDSIERKKNDFLSWYKGAYRQSWLKFAHSFPAGAYKLTASDEQLAVARKIAGGEGPYFAFLDRMAKELPVCLGDDETPPDWMAQVFDFSAVRNHVEKPEPQVEQDIIKAVKKKGMSLLGRAGKIAAAHLPSPEALKASGEIYVRYKQSLEGLAMSCASRPAAFKLASEVFKEDQGMGESFLSTSRRNGDELKLSFPHHAERGNVAARLIDCPSDFLWNIAAKKAACHIQDLWSETVLSEVQGMTDKKAAADMLMGKDGGLVIGFVKGPVAPFVGRDTRRGYFAKNSEGKTIPFNPGFFSYLTRGALSTHSEQSQYKVKIEGVPTDANPDAGVIPHVTRLNLECASGDQTLEYYNYPSGKVFEWAPDSCGDVNLSVSIGDVVLKKSYTGFRAFPRFLKDFRDGQHTFYRADFEEESPALKRMGIKFIKVKYKITGGGPAISILNVDTCRVPEVIVSCSD